MSTLTTLLNACQTINAAISGVAYAPQVSDYPPDLTPDKYPAMISLPGPAVWFGRTGGLGSGRKSQRTIVIRCYVAALSIEDVGAALAQAFTLMEAVGTTYQALKTVGGATMMYSVGVGMEDLGMVREIAYGGGKFYGFETRLILLEPPA